jgi:hypothetical protein
MTLSLFHGQASTHAQAYLRQQWAQENYLAFQSKRFLTL